MIWLTPAEAAPPAYATVKVTMLCPLPDNKEENNSEVSELASEAISDNASLLVSDLKGRMELVDYGNKLVEKDLVQGTWGNISVRLDEEYMLTTPSGLDYDDCRPEDMVRVNIETLKPEDSLNDPTSEKSIHAEIYKARPDVGAIVHTHSKYCSLLAACRMPLEVREESLAKDVGELILVADYGESGSTTLAKNVVEALGERKGCIMSHHGMVACGKDIEEALSIAMSMEEAARLQVEHGYMPSESDEDIKSYGEILGSLNYEPSVTLGRETFVASFKDLQNTGDLDASLDLDEFTKNVYPDLEGVPNGYTYDAKTDKFTVIK